MRLARALDRYLAQMQVERDFTARTVDGYYRTLEDHVFTVEIETWEGPNRIRRRRDPKEPPKRIQSRTKALWTMTQRVCKRAGVTPFGPHALRHGFANDFLRDSDRDVYSLKLLMRHSSLATTEQYLAELTMEELEVVLERVDERRRERGTSVSRSGDEAPHGSPERVKAADGPGRSRTSGETGPASDPGADRADPADDPDLADPKGGHKP
jgi:hypothetical protein